MKESLTSPISMLNDDTNHFQEQKTPPDYRLISNPFDPPTSVHLKQRLANFSIFNKVRRISFFFYLNGLIFFSNKKINLLLMFYQLNVVLKYIHNN